MKFQLIEADNSLGVNVDAFDFLKKEGFKIKHGRGRDYFLGESFYEYVTIEINSLKEMEKLLLLSKRICLSAHNDQDNTLIIREYINEEI